MQFKNAQVMNFEGAFRGLRNPLESWKKSDSSFGVALANYSTSDHDVVDTYCLKAGLNPYDQKYEPDRIKYLTWLSEEGILNMTSSHGYEICEYAFIGPDDLRLAQRMIKAGASDRKFMRQIMVSVDITAPLYWWKEFDTYKVGTVANSTSTMHKLASTPITRECFEMDDFAGWLELYPAQETKTDKNTAFTVNDMVNMIVDYCERLRLKYIETKDKRYWKELIRWLPNGWVQTRTVTFNYEILRNMYFQRKNHKLTEWHQFCKWVENLPYGKDLICYE